jgi:hypothetical protein
VVRLLNEVGILLMETVQEGKSSPPERDGASPKTEPRHVVMVIIPRGQRLLVLVVLVRLLVVVGGLLLVRLLVVVGGLPLLAHPLLLHLPPHTSSEPEGM